MMSFLKGKEYTTNISACLRLCLVGILSLVRVAGVAQSEAEHLSHHPEQAGVENAPGGGERKGPSGAAGMGGPGGGMMGGGGMGGMMEKMGAPKPRDLYPSMMGISEMDPAMKDQVGRQSMDRMRAGTSLMNQAMDRLASGTASDNYPAMQKAVSELREALAQFDSGLSAQRALSEGKSPRNVALQWFKREMNLTPARLEEKQHIFGGSSFHLVVIVILGSFAGIMIWMYFFKMRRASMLVDQLSKAASGAPPTRLASASVPPELVEKPRPTPALTPEPVKPPSFPVMKTRTEPVQKWSGKLRVCQVFDECPGVRTLRLASPDEIALPFTYYPGQFVTLAMTLDGKPVKRSYTIASSPTQLHYCGLTIKREANGLVSRYLHDQVKEGDLLEVSGPNGKFVFTGEEADRITLIGGGVGITPLMSVVRYLTDIGWKKEIYFLYCCRTPEDFIYREELELLQERHSNLHIAITITRPEGTAWMGLTGRFTAGVVEHIVPEIQSSRIHVCGPGNMMSGVLALLKELNIPQENIKTEAFGPAKKPAVPTNALPVAPAFSAKGTSVEFKRAEKTVTMAADETVLDVADKAGVEIDSSCRSGQCGLCKVKLLAGEVTMECEDSLSEEEKTEGQILACQAKATGNIEVDA